MFRTLRYALVLSWALAQPVLAHRDHSVTAQTDSPEAWAELLAEFRRSGRQQLLQRAVKIAQQVGAEQYTPQQAYLAAQTAQADHRFDEAIALLQPLLQQEPAYDAARLMLANTLRLKGDRQTSLTHCHQLRTSNLPIRLTCQLRANQDRQTYQRLRRLLEHESATFLLGALSEPLAAWVLATLGEVALANHEPEQAADYLQQAMALDANAGYALSLVDALQTQGRADAALAITHQYPGHLAMRVKRAIALHAAGRPDPDLEARLMAELRHDFRHGDLAHGRELAELLLHQHQPAAALEVLRAAMQHQHGALDEQLQARALAALSL